MSDQTTISEQELLDLQTKIKELEQKYDVERKCNLANTAELIRADAEVGESLAAYQQAETARWQALHMACVAYRGITRLMAMATITHELPEDVFSLRLITGKALVEHIRAQKAIRAWSEQANAMKEALANIRLTLDLLE